jgi:tetratricopeptide (TPR) repeat protein
VGCGGGGGGGEPTETAADLTSQGWALFVQGKYEEAIEKFTRATQLDANYADAYNGLGWSYANTKVDSLPKALINFNLCIAKDTTHADPYAGRAPVYRDLIPPQFQDAINTATTALSKVPQDSLYEFVHYKDFNWRDLHLIKAQCYYGLKEYTQALAEVVILDPEYEGDPGSATFVRDLAAKIEDLARSV